MIGENVEFCCGLDFGTTNSSLSVLQNGESRLIPIDGLAIKKEVVRSALYFFPRLFKTSDKVSSEQLFSNTFMYNQFWYEGEEKISIGEMAVSTYLKDNCLRHSGIKRKIYTGKYKNIILYTTPGGKVVTGDVPDYYEETDYGTGRLFHALKTALKSHVYEGAVVFGNKHSLEEMISMFIREMKLEAEKYLGRNIDSVICGRPVKFSVNKETDRIAQSRLKDALRLAGFKNISFKLEPVAAARYFFSKFPDKGETILVFDFGGGTFDTTIMKKSGDASDFEVLSTAGIYVGGDLLNSEIFFHKLGRYFGTEIKYGDNQMGLPGHILSGLGSWFSIPNLNNPVDIHFLTETVRYKNTNQVAIDWLLHLIQKNLGFEMYEAIELAKKELTKKESTRIRFKDLPIDIDVEITRGEFESLIKCHIDSVKRTVLSVVNKSGLGLSDIDVVVRTGGSSLIPMVEEMLRGMFGMNKVVEFDPFVSVAGGLVL